MGTLSSLDLKVNSDIQIMQHLGAGVVASPCPRGRIQSITYMVNYENEAATGNTHCYGHT